jgi:7-carboxy-7-deazaguanine synthase
MSHYQINEIFFSLQGEGVRAGEPSIFVRFSGCNLTCNGSIEGEAFAPVCDTEFISGRRLDCEDIIRIAQEASAKCRWIVFTGGEPALQLDDELVIACHQAGYEVAIETNGTRPLPSGIDWITVSPKTAEHCLAVSLATEVKYVRQLGQGIPRTSIQANYYLISPAFDASGLLQRDTLRWSINLCKEHPPWRLSIQQHKAWSVR